MDWPGCHLELLCVAVHHRVKEIDEVEDLPNETFIEDEKVPIVFMFVLVKCFK
jgi:hypothetical protein